MRVTPFRALVASAILALLVLGLWIWSSAYALGEVIYLIIWAFTW